MLVDVLVLRQLNVTPVCEASLVALLGIRRIAPRGAGTRGVEVGDCTERQGAGLRVSFPSTRRAQMLGEGLIGVEMPNRKGRKMKPGD